MYTPLHLKYRPQQLSQIIGQEHIVRTLDNAILSGGSHSTNALSKIAPAYLFTGPKGTGKTSTARILAKSLNCLSTEEPTTKPCGECNSCQTISHSSSLDVTELDAASHSGVDNIREIVSNLQLKPIESRRKILIVDECHALSHQSWQALLKTVEQPPTHVVFIFCTTEVHKVPETIISRCQKFDFRRVSLSLVVDYLEKVAHQESINITPTALTAIAKACHGHLRDSLKLLDQLTLLGFGEITPNWVWELSGTIPEHDLVTFCENITKGEMTGNLGILQDWMKYGKHPITIHTSLVSFLKDLLICKTNPNGRNLTELEEDTWKELTTISKSWSINHIQSAIALLMARQNLMRDEGAHLWLQATLIEIVSTTSSPQAQPWKNWKTAQDAINWGKEQLPHLSQAQLQEHWQKLTPINGKKAPAWVQLVEKLQTA
ncbi:DNA polymerase III subunit gamma/tau (plasmid) [Brasilonema octagenarum UFV-E1]|uniref:DNA polymerase III subunit gamma/tau n=1 Tax=Brasilonema sennae CENA114 TaxID=415709 RepID=A0A856MRB2_9CYAN|nr:DNA polymerase III subunit gamma/tau [Brasilonema sennae]QDL12710.1 DNA polymerase III subunit gamma/tau [Brasilonema sennae CENA114]QDL19105.1 DNA polymerase III subunit gamma/tau [Brasilonema octagenarum UFV-E1]